MKVNALQRALEHLAVLVEIRSRKQEKEDEDNLVLILLALLATYFEDSDAEAFKVAFLFALRNAFEELDPDDVYGDLIDREIAFQSGYLANFIHDMRNGQVSEAQARARAKQYALSLGKLRERIELEQLDSEAKGRWQINESLENCPDCILLNGQIHTNSWFIHNHIPKDGRTQCGGNCGCVILPI